jgi:CheY-like chemotaxis protein
VNFRVTEAEQAITGRAPGRYVGITLADTGHGMTPEVRAKVFEPFFTTKGPGRGTGLGLAVVHGIVSQSGGYIDVASTLGTGTTFTILLPVAKEGLTAEHAEAETTPGGDETILLVEDEEVVRRVAARALRNHGYTVIEARDGADALTVLSRARQEIDLLLTDVVMPRMDGRTLAETIAKSHPATRVVYMSGYTDDAVVRHGVQRAEVQFLQKPYTVCGLLTKVRVALDAQGAPAETQRLAGVS